MEIMEEKKKYSLRAVVCDDCLTAASDFIENPMAEREALEEICTVADGMPDHRCLKLEGFEDRCDCLSH